MMPTPTNRLDALIEEVFKLRDVAKAVSIAAEQIIFDLERLRPSIDSSQPGVVDRQLDQVAAGVRAIHFSMKQLGSARRDAS
ncbi:hypothetical protein Z045_05625 [Rhodococcus pyridinivorans KG-16]|uniref:Uncharacterized protein n=1 Tax=Rhodococcus pyridinivorans KG-16 TaxID=1441730 RepID=A0A0V9UNT1_9NOCA|nr:hypothetical protein [Rhodococcus pyridinivorans]KSZ59651.1 hypothetical protein Z045_05625 [Rhodococcus pyridinivorans KG-16]